MPRPFPRRQTSSEITYSSAKHEEINILHEMTLWEEIQKFVKHVYRRRKVIQSIAAFHLGLSTKENCHVAPRNDWIQGSFNLCIPIVVKHGNHRPDQHVMIRLPLPYRVGEAFRPGNADEKLRCEAGAYIWLQQNCPDVPIAHLYGFGLSTGQSFTALENLPVLLRCSTYIRHQLFSWVGYPLPSRYICQRTQSESITDLGVGYLLLEYVDESQGRMLSYTWEEKSQDVKLRSNFFRSLSRIFLSFARVPLPQIGSLIIGDDGVVRLANRPLSLEMAYLENQHIPVEIPRNLTYSTVDSYVSDILAYHENRLRHQPNAVNSMVEGLYQTSALTTMRAIFPRFFQAELRRGPFIFCLTDLHPSNLFVDDQWNITKVLDLEWACSRPVEMLHPPPWLTNQPIDGIDAYEYERLHREFMEALEEEEEIDQGCVKPEAGFLLSKIIRKGWDTGTLWYSLALEKPTGLFALFYDHNQPRFARGHINDANFLDIMKCYWSKDVDSFIEAKVKDKQDYDLKLGHAFGRHTDSSSS